MRPLIIFLAIVAATVGSGWWLIHPSVPDDEMLIRHFRKNSAALSEISDFFTKNPALRYIDQGSTMPEDVSSISIAPPELEEMRKKLATTGFQSAGIELGSGRLSFIYMSAGLVTGGVTKGLLHSASEPQPIKDILNDMGWRTYSHVRGYRRIEGSWYIFFYRD